MLADGKEIRQLILNLVHNGFEAMSPGGKLSIKTYMKNNTVVLVVQDQGSGIDSKNIYRIGTPFFTTKDNGTGLDSTSIIETLMLEHAGYYPAFYQQTGLRQVTKSYRHHLI